MEVVNANFYFNKDDDYVRRIVARLSDVELVSNRDLIEMIFEEEAFKDFALSDEILALREFVNEEIANRYTRMVQGVLKRMPEVVVVNGVEVKG